MTWTALSAIGTTATTMVAMNDGWFKASERQAGDDGFEGDHVYYSKKYLSILSGPFIISELK